MPTRQAVRTPLLSNRQLDAVAGGRVLVKPECLQVTGSFKIRGAYNFLSQLGPDEAKRGVVAFSSGNHAQGVAAAGTMLGIQTAWWPECVTLVRGCHVWCVRCAWSGTSLVKLRMTSSLQGQL